MLTKAKMRVGELRAESPKIFHHLLLNFVSLHKLIIGSAEALPILCVRYIR